MTSLAARLASVTIVVFGCPLLGAGRMGVALRRQDAERVDHYRRRENGASSMARCRQSLRCRRLRRPAIRSRRGRRVSSAASRSFRDFELTAEFWSAEDTDSGLLIRCATPANPGSLGSCYEINISDPHATTPTGGIVGVHSTLPYRVKSAGEWSRFDVLAEGTHLVVKVNGETLTDVNDNKFSEGALGLQAGVRPGRASSSSGISGFVRFERRNKSRKDK